MGKLFNCFCLSLWSVVLYAQPAEELRFRLSQQELTEVKKTQQKVPLVVGVSDSVTDRRGVDGTERYADATGGGVYGQRGRSVLPVAERLAAGGVAAGFSKTTDPVDAEVEKPVVPERLAQGGAADGFSKTADPVDIEEEKPLVPNRFALGGAYDGYAKTTDPVDAEEEKPVVPNRFALGGTDDGYTWSRSVSDEEVEVPPLPERLAAGGVDDGLSLSGQPLRIVAVESLVAECAGSSALLRVIAVGSDLSYRWERYDATTYSYETFVPERPDITGAVDFELRFGILNLTDEGFYRCVVYNLTEEATSEPFAVSLDGAPVLKGKLKRVWELCEGPGTIDLAVIARSPNGKPLTYQWYKDNLVQPGAVTGGLTVSSQQKSNEGLYRIEVKNACGTVADTAQVKINTPARVADDQQLLTACDGGLAEFVVKASGGGYYEGELHEVKLLQGEEADKPRFEFLPGVAGSGMKVMKHVTQADHGKTYVWIVRNDCGSDTSGVITLSIVSLPKIGTFTPGPLTLCAGERLELNCTTMENRPEESFQWYRNDLPVGAGKQFTVAGLRLEDAGMYQCRVNHRLCPELVTPTAVIKVTVETRPEISRVITATGVDYCVGRSLTLTGKVYGTYPVDSVRWFRDGVALHDEAGHLKGTATAELTFTAIAAADKGNYTMRAFNYCRSSETDPWKLTPDIPAHFLTGLDDYDGLQLCSGDNQVVTVAADGTAPVMYMWTHNGVKIGDGYSNSITLKGMTVDSSGIYCCEIHNKCTDLSVRKCAAVKVYSPTDYRLTGQEEYCAANGMGTTLELAGSDTACTYTLWRDGESYLTVKGGDVIPAGGPIRFSPVFAGSYEVKAVLDTNGCIRTMPGRITVRENSMPATRRLRLKEQLCGGHGAVLALDTTEQSVAYQLYEEISGEWRLTGSAKNGNGGWLLWNGIGAGRYRAEAMNRWTGCTTVLPDTVEVVRRELPEPAVLQVVGGDSLYCANATSDVALKIETTEAGCIYSLQRNGKDTLSSLTAPAPITWTGVGEGLYQVVVRNEWGCTLPTNVRKVKTQAPPRRYALTGSASYCRGTEAEWPVTLEGSEAGVVYELYRVSGVWATEKMVGTGAALAFSVPSEEALYRVTAGDTTAEACRDTMNGEVRISPVLLLAAGDPELLTADYGKTVTLKISVTGGEVPLSYHWEPAEALKRNDVAEPETKEMLQGEIFTVTVTDHRGCETTAQVGVRVNGSPLRAEIRRSDRVTAVDSVSLCRGVPFSLYGWQDGGVSGDYLSGWSEDGRVIANGQLLNDYRKMTPGYLYFRVTRGEGMEVSDSVWVGLKDTVVAYDLAVAGLSCVDTARQQIVLKQAEPGVAYRLEYSPDGQHAFIGVADTVALTEQPLAMLTPEGKPYGFYRIRGEKQGCVGWMNGIAELQRQPALFEVGGSCEYCAGWRMDTVSLSGSEKGMVYSLWRATEKIAELPGTGRPLFFTGAYGVGNYKIEAASKSCLRQMSGSAIIRVNPLPESKELIGCGAFCGSDLPLNLQLEAVETQVKYVLKRYRNGLPAEEVELTDAAYCVEEIGRYEVIASNRLTGCRRRLTDTLLVDYTPAAAKLVGGGFACEPAEEVLTQVKLWPAESGVDYVLYDEWGSGRWNMTERTDDTLSFSGFLPDGSYRVRAESGSCHTELEGTVEAELIVFPVNTALTFSGDYCFSARPASVGVKMSSPEVTYTLWQVTGDVRKELAVLAGNGGRLELGVPAEAGEYTVEMARKNCAKRVPGTLRVLPEAAQVKVSGGGFGCDLGEGKEAEITLSEAEAGQLYQLYDSSNVCLGDFSPAGEEGVFTYAGKLKAGTYTVRTALGSCVTVMKQKVSFTELNRIQDIPLSGAGEYCGSATPVEMGLPLSEATVSYTLWFDSYASGRRALATREGGGAVSFGSYGDAGLYEVVATNAAGCTRTLSAKVRIGMMPENPMVSGGADYCATLPGADVVVKMWPWTEGVGYRLWQRDTVAGAAFGYANGDTLYYAGILPKGEYRVEARLGKCRTLSDSVVRISELPAPADSATLQPSGEVCLFAPQEIRVSNPEPEVTYYLYRGDVQVASGKASFGEMDVPGEYHMVARYDRENGCERKISSGLNLKLPPKPFRVTGDAFYCDGTVGAAVVLKAWPTESGKSYRLCRLPGLLPVETLSDRVGDTLYYKGRLTEGKYMVVTETKGCSRYAEDTIRITKRALVLNNLYRPLTLCEGEGMLTMGVESGQPGVRYELWKEGTPDVKLATEYGDGNPLGLGNYGEKSTYYVVATDTVCGITRNFAQEYRIGERPALFAVTGDSVYCASGEGVKVGLSGSRAGTSYRLQRSDRVNGEFSDVKEAVFAGNGGAFDFSGYYREGCYRVMANNGCDLLMQGARCVKKKQEPDTALIPEVAGACSGADMAVGLLTEAGVNYTLLRGYTDAVGTLAGDGEKQYFMVPAAVAGVYAILAEREGCERLLPRTVEVGATAMKPELAGDTVVCGHRGTSLSIVKAEAGVTYRLKNQLNGMTYAGTMKPGSCVFENIPSGTYRAIASRGDCQMEGEPWTIDSLRMVTLQPDVWSGNDCIKTEEGEIRLTKTDPSQNYLLYSSTPGWKTVVAGGIDTVLRALPAGSYYLRAQDLVSGCLSDSLTRVIREEAFDARLVLPLAYCEGLAGMRLQLEMPGNNMEYRIFTDNGTEMERIVAPATQFARDYREGNYLLQKNRTGFGGGCRLEEPFEVKMIALPDEKLRVVTDGGAHLCAGSFYRVTLKSTQKEVVYKLQREDETTLESLVGDGTDLTFIRSLTEAGRYVIRAEGIGGCSVMLDTVIRLYDLPQGVVLKEGSYCSALPGEMEAGGSVSLTGMREGVDYILTDLFGSSLDTIVYPMTAFGPQPADYYKVRAVDRNSGCAAEQGAVRVVRKLSPGQLQTEYQCGNRAEVALTEASEGDTVTYKLYRDAIYTGMSLPGTGSDLSFGWQEVPGVYRIRAEKNEGCGVWMKDSVFVYAPPASCRPEITGDLCKPTGAGVVYGCSGKDWYYYIKSGLLCSDTLKGGPEPLAWNKVGGKLLVAGTYKLMAFNACEQLYIDSVTLKTLAEPLPQHPEGDTILCPGMEADVVLAGSEPDVLYQLVSHSSHQLFPAVRGTGGRLKLNDRKLTEAGAYTVYGRRDGSPCDRVVAVRTLVSGVLPELRQVTGNNACVSAESGSGITLCMASLETGVSYVLVRMAGTDTEQAVLPAGSEQLCFPEQKEVGVYKVVGRHQQSGCRLDMAEQYTLGKKANRYALANGGSVVTLCPGQDTVICLWGSDIGVVYQVWHDGEKLGAAVAGTGKVINLARAGSSGKYYVEGINDCGGEWMTDTVEIQLHPVVELDLQSRDVHYCENLGGIRAGVVDARADYAYRLYDEDLKLLKGMEGVSGSLQVFDTLLPEGSYLVTATELLTGCMVSDRLAVTADSVPEVFRLFAPAGPYICGNEGLEVKLDGSRPGVAYALFREGREASVAEEAGTGDVLLLQRLSLPGIYRAEARMMENGCSIAMADTLELLTPPRSLQAFIISAVKPSYCYTDAAKGSVVLSGSEPGVRYQLLQNGTPWAAALAGDGTILTWNGVEGTDFRLPQAYVYTVSAEDTLTHCTKMMNDRVKIVEEREVEIQQFHPNKSLKVCVGETQDFNVVATGYNLHYKWYHKDRNGIEGLLADTLVWNEPYYQIDSVTENDYGTYWCTVSNSCAVTAKAPVPVVLLDYHQIAWQPEKMKDYRICGNAGKPIVLDAGMRNAKYFEWYKQGDESVKYQTELLTVERYADGDAYVCHAWSDCNHLYDTCVIRLDGKPAIRLLQGDSVAVCIGSRYEMEIATTDNFTWLQNGQPLAHRLPKLAFDTITRADEGLYSVRVSNGCGDSVFVVAELLVDDTLRLKEVLPGMHPVVCTGRSLMLSVETTSARRVAYEWRYGSKVLDNTGPLYHIASADRTNTLQTYTVYFRNACRPAPGVDDFVEIRIERDDTIRYKDPVREVIACADPAREIVLRVEHPLPQVVAYQWFRFNHQADTVVMASAADTITIPLSSSQNGYYYCRLRNNCEVVATNSCWFRVDSVPVPMASLADDTLCEGEQLLRTLPSTGGSMYYAWVMQSRNGQVDTLSRSRKELFDSESQLRIPSLTMAYDSCLIWCYLKNDCGAAVSDTMLLRVRQGIQLKVTPDTTVLCGNNKGRVVVHLLTGEAPWSYTWHSPDGGLTREESLYAFDTLPVSRIGKYAITLAEDAGGCRRTSQLPEFVVVSREVPELFISGGGRRCIGDTVSLRIRIEGGEGPWRLWLADKYNSSVPVACPLYLTTRDTSLSLTVMDSALYYGDIIEDLYGGSGFVACEGRSFGRAEVKVAVPDVIDFALSGEDHIGQCNTVELHAKLNPSLRYAGTPVTGDYFYLNDHGDPLSGSELTLKRLEGLKGEQKVTCKYTDAAGCLVTSGEVALYVDTLPSALLDAGNGHACGNVETEYTVALSGAPKFTLELEQRVLSYSRFHKDEKFRSWTPDLEAKDMVYKGTYPWRDEDSCMILRVVAITDRHACRITDGMPSDTIYHHLYPDLEMWTRYPDKTTSGWNKGMSPVYISRGDSVGVKAELTQGDRPWNLVCSPRGSISGIRGADTVFALDTGRYRLTAVHAHCGVSADFGEELVVQYLDTGYLKLKVWLDGPLDLVTGKMVSSIEEHLPLYGLKALPAHGADRQIIDWIEVELRTGNDIDSIAAMGQGALRITRDSCLLWSDGTVTDRWGDTTVLLPQACAGSFNNYHVVLRHRNHLAVMSAGRYKISRTRKDAVKADFTKPENIYCSRRYPALKDHMSYLEYGGIKYWTLSAGDMNENRLVSVFDPNRVNLDELQGKPVVPAPGGYHSFDVNFDGVIGWPGWNGKGTGTNTLDWDKVRGNRYKFTEIKF